jgi:rod shape-determining protein MreD
VRLAILAAVVVLVQITFVSQINVLGTSADLLPLVAASVGLLCGSVPGALFGFGIGLLADLALVQDLGVSSLLLVGVGYAAGRLRELRDPSHALVPLAVGALATFATVLGLALIQFSLGVDAPVSALPLVRELLTVCLVNALLALPVHALVRRALAPALPDGGRPRRSRRRRPSGGGLSPLTSSRP